MTRAIINIQILLYFSSGDFKKLLDSITFLITGESHLSFIFVDQSEDEKEYSKNKRSLDNIKIRSKNIQISLDKQPNYGFGKGHNEIYRKYKNKYEDFFIILNPDSILHHDLLTNIETYLNQLQNQNWGLLELQQFPSEHPKYYNPKTLETNWCSGAGLIINKNAFEDLGMFDENIFMYGEDVDLSMRMRMNGYKTLHLPEAKFTHLTKDTDVSKESDFTRIHKQASELYLRYKFAKDRDVKKYMSLIGENDPHYEEIITKYKEMKKNLSKRTYYRKFVDRNQDYTNFRWII